MREPTNKYTPRTGKRQRTRHMTRQEAHLDKEPAALPVFFQIGRFFPQVP